ncbi:hypothetical protein Tco_0881124 [Tanacetum coccineum]
MLITVEDLHFQLSEELRNMEAFSVEEDKTLKAYQRLSEKIGEELQTKTTKRQKIDDKDAQSTKEKEKEPVKKMGKRRKQIARKGLHTAKDEAEKNTQVKNDRFFFSRDYTGCSEVAIMLSED